MFRSSIPSLGARVWIVQDSLHAVRREAKWEGCEAEGRERDRERGLARFVAIEQEKPAAAGTGDLAA
jgi:hypothetical protein